MRESIPPTYASESEHTKEKERKVNVRICQHTLAYVTYVSIRQHTLAYVSTRERERTYESKEKRERSVNVRSADDA